MPTAAPQIPNSPEIKKWFDSVASMEPDFYPQVEFALEIMCEQYGPDYFTDVVVSPLVSSSSWSITFAQKTYVLLRDVAQKPCAYLDDLLDTLVKMHPALKALTKTRTLSSPILGKIQVQEWFKTASVTSREFSVQLKYLLVKTASDKDLSIDAEVIRKAKVPVQ